jgi:hypothetical protein
VIGKDNHSPPPPPPPLLKVPFLGRIGCGAEQERQRQESGLKLAVVIEKSAIFSTRTDRWVLPSFKEWKFSKLEREVSPPASPRMRAELLSCLFILIILLSSVAGGRAESV